MFDERLATINEDELESVAGEMKKPNNIAIGLGIE